MSIRASRVSTTDLSREQCLLKQSGSASHTYAEAVQAVPGFTPEPGDFELLMERGLTPPSGVGIPGSCVRRQGRWSAP
jgi:hypothetical protein